MSDDPFEKNLMLHKLNEVFEAGTIDDQVKFCLEFIGKHMPLESRIEHYVNYLRVHSPHSLKETGDPLINTYQDMVASSSRVESWQKILREKSKMSDKERDDETLRIMSVKSRAQPVTQNNDFTLLMEAIRKKDKDLHEYVLKKQRGMKSK